MRAHTWNLAMWSGAIALLLSSSACAKDKRPEPGSWKTQLTAGDEKLKIQDIYSAEVFYRQAVKDVMRDPTASLDDRAQCELVLADILQVMDKAEQSLQLYKDVLRKVIIAHNKNCREEIPVLLRLGRLWEFDLDYERARKYNEKALAIVTQTDGENSIACANCEHQMGHMLIMQDKSSPAIALYDHALETLMREHELTDSDLLERVLDDYIDALSHESDKRPEPDSAYAHELLKDRIDSIERGRGTSSTVWYKRLTGQKSPGVPLPSQPTLPSTNITPYHPLADRAALEQMQKQRETFYKRMIATDVDSLGADHPSVARDLYGLASVYLAQSKFAQAKPLLQRALTIYQHSYRQEAAPIKALKGLLASLEEDTRQFNSGLGTSGGAGGAPPPGNSRASGTGTATGTGTSPGTSRASGRGTAYGTGTEYVTKLVFVPLPAQKLEIALRLDRLALLCYEKGMLPQSKKILAWALADAAYTCGESSMLAASCLIDYGNLSRSLGNYADADLMQSCAHILTRESLRKEAELAIPR